ncbi:MULTISPECIES: endonuclease [unclassified Polaribacter]|uniref:endonuclease n=1 Tax=unclassified Polaribacter TaxID=196858 RepID=UPI0011BE783F|nr:MULTISPECIES: endonuclease [unclassified Polaribacter]TXD52105.1 T9SS type A sorting domain-containing protein [Polaribacter sp. IC063]TXD59959.1 T9SS type A sorting domain-containing protein [Polaribacter sp. IC066]
MTKKLLTVLTILWVAQLSFAQVQPYYNDVDLTLYGLELKDALAVKTIAAHSRFLEYTSSGPDVWDATKITDDNINFSGDVVLFYGWEDGSDQDDTNDFSRDNRAQDKADGNSFVWNREHVFPKSLANPVLDTNVPGPATDAHHLRAADRTRNSTRNNRKYGRGSGTSNFSSIDSHEGLDGPNTSAWYPGDQWKGDAARMIMYMYIRYGSVCLPTAVGVGSKKFTEDEMIDLFLQWNAEDPVSAIEIARNTYHGNAEADAAQGNRNPFIDNPYLATRIWGGDSAEDRWDFYKKTDTKAPTKPLNVTVNNITLNSLDFVWTASTDNIGVTLYNVYVNDILEEQTTNTTISLSNLSSNTSYSVTIIAKDLINNKSDASIAVNARTLEDTEAPTTPMNVMVRNQTDSSFKVSWSAASDNNAVGDYEVFVDGTLNGSTSAIFYTVSGLDSTTSYSVEVLAKDVDNNKSNKSAAITATTTAGTFNGVSELFISEYAEPASGNEKAIEIVNLSGATINLSAYSIQKQSNGGTWVDDYPLGNVDIIPGDVFVIVHADVTEQVLLNEADLFGPPNEDTSPYGFGSPLNFNGNDPIGLYKDGVLIDIVGFEDDSSKHIENKTYRRKAPIAAPNTRFDKAEWEILAAGTFDGFGSHASTLSTKENVLSNFSIYPNPTNGNEVFFSISENATVHLYTLLGKRILTAQLSENKNAIDVTSLSKGIYMVKVSIGEQTVIQKLIKN